MISDHNHPKDSQGIELTTTWNYFKIQDLKPLGLTCNTSEYPNKKREIYIWKLENTTIVRIARALKKQIIPSQCDIFK